ncbi:hypothetical protein J5N97_002604 [Dioscorea zingiberensis]|uniref:Uncharacterized protein n=1 Tax=Dioscorea zingiberensis TaxID=325984 RepID=A0A9D5D527_9LILI|nr:hypothetical protein J5N97_002604 [Dioscorea zingiberensis]
MKRHRTRFSVVVSLSLFLRRNFMAARGRMRSAIVRRSIQAPGMMHHGPLPGIRPARHHLIEALPPSGDLENKLRMTVELLEVNADRKKLPDLHSELEDLKQEHQKLCGTFGYEKGLNRLNAHGYSHTAVYTNPIMSMAMGAVIPVPVSAKVIKPTTQMATQGLRF